MKLYLINILDHEDLKRRRFAQESEVSNASNDGYGKSIAPQLL